MVMAETKTKRTLRGCLVYWLKLGIFAFVALYIAYFVVAIEYSVRPAPSEICCRTPAEAGLAYEDVQFASADGVMLHGWYIPSQNGAAIILLHGYDNNRLQMLDRASFLAQQGYGVLLYDLRGHGESESDLRAFGWPDVPDVATAVAFLTNQPEVEAGRIGILGFSVGGQVALRAAAELPGIQAVVADGAAMVDNRDSPQPESFIETVFYVGNFIVYTGTAVRTGIQTPLSIQETIATVSPKPVLLIAAGGENSIERRMGEAYFAQAQEPKELWLIPETGHGQGLAARPEEYAERVVSFFDKALLE